VVIFYPDVYKIIHSFIGVWQKTYSYEYSVEFFDSIVAPQPAKAQKVTLPIKLPRCAQPCEIIAKRTRGG